MDFNTDSIQDELEKYKYISCIRGEVNTPLDHRLVVVVEPRFHPLYHQERRTHPKKLPLIQLKY